MNNFGKHYEIEYSKYNYNLNDTPDIYEQIKKYFI